jgi:predicted DNA-binding antitoxin AbrB/MazE fold protein
MTIPAKYENGAFKPLEAVQIKEGTVVEVHVPARPESGGPATLYQRSPFFRHVEGPQ